MKTFNQVIALMCLVSSSWAFAGAEGAVGGNGGGAHVCKDSVELYDFYEGRHPLLHKIPVWENDPRLSVQDYLEKVKANIRKTSPDFEALFSKSLNEFLKLPYGERVLPIAIPRIMDADIPFVDEDCEYRQVANWNERFGNVFFSKGLFDRMDSMSQAGLIVHEVIYKMARDLGRIKSSDDVRKIVAKLFSNTRLTINDFLSILPESPQAIIPKNGMCKFSYWYDSKNMSNFNTQTHINFDGKNIRVMSWQVPCSDLIEKGFKLQIFVQAMKDLGLLRVSTKLNAREFSLCEFKEIQGKVIYPAVILECSLKRDMLIVVEE